MFNVLLSTVSSDSHTWNLVYLQLVLEDRGYRVGNLGACVPDQLLVDRARTDRPDLVVISTVNGHGAQDGARVVRLLRAQKELAGTPIVIGGKLGIEGNSKAAAEELLAAGFDAVFDDDADMGRFYRFLESVTNEKAAQRSLAAVG
ncbi:cobalamin B12-binding domain-containing protein [Kribbella sp. NBC_00382]|uniref:cobalamin B12-binding domain-containing protein n=1 Tax=Kribbella sp. NBC_00382 TaxID=2975967 RepID=UPI002E225CCB|nr:cobalamin-dependent protein [Kribbella sp. NBC_00382]